MRPAVLIGGATTLHCAPEGMASGIAVASRSDEVASGLAVVLGEMVPSRHGHERADASPAAFLVGFASLDVVDALSTGTSTPPLF